jgi:hypothetical protein
MCLTRRLPQNPKRRKVGSSALSAVEPLEARKRSRVAEQR